jgi:hypothetical protein
MGSDQMAAEALQEAETEVGVAVKVDRMSVLAQTADSLGRSTNPAIDLGLTA